MANQNTPSVPEQEQDSNALRQIRLDKLRQRQADGNDPFTITKYDVLQRQPASRRTMKSPRQSSRKRPARTKRRSRQSWIR